MACGQQAINFFNENKRAAAEIYVKYEPQKNGVDWIYNILQKPELINFTSTPHGNEKIADFMFKTKLLRNRPRVLEKTSAGRARRPRTAIDL